MKKFRNFFNTNFGIQSLIANIIGIILGISFWVLDANITIPIWVFLSITSILIFIIWILLLKLLSPQQNIHPMNLEIVRFHIRSNRIICILRPCEYIAYGTYVTFFHKLDGLESYLATGLVVNIQGDNFIQVELLDITSLTSYTEDIKTNNISFIQNLFVKPIVTNNFIERKEIT